MTTTTNQLFTLTLAALLFSCQEKPAKHPPQPTNKTSSESATTSHRPGFDTSKALQEKTLLDYIVTAKTIKPNIQNGIPFNKLDYDKIIAYDFEGCEEPYPAVIDAKGRFVPVITAQAALTQPQADKILSTLTKKSTYGAGTAACFAPHFALVFFRNNHNINQINICLDCNYLTSGIDIPAETHKKINKGTEDEYVLNGFTASGKNAIVSLCKELNFYYGRRKKE